MSENASSPLLGSNRPQRSPSQRSEASSVSRRSNQAIHTTESSPLLRSQDEGQNYGNAPEHDAGDSPAESWLRRLQDRTSGKGVRRRWPTVVALVVLTIAVLVILGLGFAAPAAMEEYAREAVVFEPTDLSIDSFTSTGVVARVQGNFKIDGSKVRKKSVRDLGRAGTWIAKAVESKETHIEVYLPEYGDVLLGIAEIPPITVCIRDGAVTYLDFLASLSAGNVDGIKNVAQDWIKGSISKLSIRGDAEIPLKSGIFGLGTQHLSETFVFAGSEIPILPPYSISRLNFHETDFPNGGKGMAADVKLNVENHYPITFDVPPLGFNILVDDCSPDLPHIHLANAYTEEIDVQARQDVEVRVRGLVQTLPDSVTKACPQTEKSPLDHLVGHYMSGEGSTIYVQGGDAPGDETPDWVVDLMKSVTLPVSFPGKSFGNLIRNFSLEDVHFGLPDPFASPKSPASRPRISTVVKAIVGLPKEMNFGINVSHVRAGCDVYYHEEKLGELDLSEWQEAKSNRIEPHGDVEAGLAVESIVKNAPLEITDEDVFSQVVQALVWGNKKVVLGVRAQVDVETETALGTFVVRDIPAEGKVFVKPISSPSDKLSTFLPKIDDLQIVNTTRKTLVLRASVNVTNPTPYSADIPYADILILNNGTQLGHITVHNISLASGNNSFIEAFALWDPTGPSAMRNDGEDNHDGDAQGRELLSQWISGFNTTLTLQPWSGSIPNYPGLGAALSNFTVTIPTPRLSTPKPSQDKKQKKNKKKKSKMSNFSHYDNSQSDQAEEEVGSLHVNKANDDNDNTDDGNDENAPHFITDATFHILTSTATFTLLSPLRHNTLHLGYLNATAYYNHTHPVGQILQIPDPSTLPSPPLPPDDDPDYDAEGGFDIPPGVSKSPFLPVDWDLLGVGFGAVKEAVGGRLKLDARAEIVVGIEEWRSGKIWYLGRGLGAGIAF